MKTTTNALRSSQRFDEPHDDVAVPSRKPSAHLERLANQPGGGLASPLRVMRFPRNRPLL